MPNSTRLPITAAMETLLNSFDLAMKPIDVSFWIRRPMAMLGSRFFSISHMYRVLPKTSTLNTEVRMPSISTTAKPRTGPVPSL